MDWSIGRSWRAHGGTHRPFDHWARRPQLHALCIRRRQQAAAKKIDRDRPTDLPRGTKAQQPVSIASRTNRGSFIAVLRVSVASCGHVSSNLTFTEHTQKKIDDHAVVLGIMRRH